MEQLATAEYLKRLDDWHSKVGTRFNLGCGMILLLSNYLFTCEYIRCAHG